MNLDERIARFVNRLVLYWAVVAGVAVAVTVISTSPSVWWIAVGVGIVILYFAMLFFGGVFFAYKIEKEKIEEPEVIVKGIEIVGRSDEVIGRYMDHDIHEWLELKIGDQVTRYMYEDIAAVQPGSDGHVLVPFEDGVALVNGMIYRRQPE
jgi:hypothetical protein